jgi:hypothetical protein
MSTKSWASISLICAVLVTTLTLTGCCSTKPIWPEFAIPSQPDYLYLPKGTQVQTKDGIYQAKGNEKWVNPRVIRLYQLHLTGVLNAKEEAEFKELVK